MLSKLMMYFQMPNVRYAFVVAILIALCAALLGVSLVLKRFSFIGDGLSHVAFGALAVASVLKITNNMVLILPVTIIAAVILLRTGKNTKIKGDSAIAMISVGAMAFGYLLLNIFPSSANITGDVCTTLFGSISIVTLTQFDVIICVVLSLISIAVFVLLYNRIFAVTFDEDFATATGTRADMYNLVIAIITAVIIVLAMNLVGSLLITALLVFPALSAMRLTKSFKKVTIFAAVISVICAVAGLLIAILFGTPVGSTIVACDAAGFVICLITGKFLR
ncbi:MAG: metal ABC transporter permease [Clostridiales bacterium]|nr:metal ABC transporter permease [Clostridiales bacterium]